MESGVLAGYPLENIKATLVDGSYHDVDSSEMAFKIAGSVAFKKASEQAKAVLLEPIMKISSGIITNKGGRTCHAAIVARELGLNAVVGAGNATAILSNGDMVTISCSEGETGRVYEGELKFNIEKMKFNSNLKSKVT